MFLGNSENTPQRFSSHLYKREDKKNENLRWKFVPPTKKLSKKNQKKYIK